jgi:hypothetical protein
MHSNTCRTLLEYSEAEEKKFLDETLWAVNCGYFMSSLNPNEVENSKSQNKTVTDFLKNRSVINYKILKISEVSH